MYLLLCSAGNSLHWRGIFAPNFSFLNDEVIFKIRSVKVCYFLFEFTLNIYLRSSGNDDNARALQSIQQMIGDSNMKKVDANSSEERTIGNLRTYRPFLFGFAGASFIMTGIGFYLGYKRANTLLEIPETSGTKLIFPQ